MAQVKAFLAAGARRDRRAFLQAAIAARVAQADAKGWKKFVRSLED